MGWWSVDIMGGDPPLDVEDNLFGMANIEKFPESGGIATLSKEWLEKNQEKIVEKYNKTHDGSDDEMTFQVLAYWMLKVGAKIKPSIKTRMITCAENDSWAQENDKRKDIMDNLVQTLQNFNGKTPIVLNQRGLFETIFSDDK